MKLTLLFFILFSTLIGCISKSKETILVNNSCDTSNVTFSKTIKPIMLTNCATSNCHAGSQASAGINLETYAGVQQYATASYNAMKNGSMPKGSNKLADCYISQMSIWINNGTPNN